MKKRIAVVGVVIVAAGAFAGSKMVTRATAATASVSQGPVKERVIARAHVVAIDGVAEVRARDDGRVLRVHVREGDMVEAGKLLAEVEADAQEAEVARLEAEQRAALATVKSVQNTHRPEEIFAHDAELRAARAEHSIAQQRYEKQVQLFDKGSVSEVARDEAKHAADIAKARVDVAQARVQLVRSGGRTDDVRTARERVAAAEAALMQAKRKLERMRVVAPVAGVIVARHVDPGDTVHALSPTLLFEIADTTRTEVRAEVEEGDAGRVAAGLDVELSTQWGESVARGRVSRVSPRVEKRNVLADPAAVRGDGLVRAVWITWDKPAGIPLGQRLEVSIELPARQVAARVPRSAVRVQNGVAVVEIAKGKGLLRDERVVRLGAADPEFVEVQGVQPGDKVVLAR
jgi:multidrug resistance efflux pump